MVLLGVFKKINTTHRKKDDTKKTPPHSPKKICKKITRHLSKYPNKRIQHIKKAKNKQMKTLAQFRYIIAYTTPAPASPANAPKCISGCAVGIANAEDTVEAVTDGPLIGPPPVPDKSPVEIAPSTPVADGTPSGPLAISRICSRVELKFVLAREISLLSRS